MENTTQVKDFLLENRQVKDVTVSLTDIPVVWHLYWLKKTEYNTRVHSPFKGAVSHNHSFFEVQLLTEGAMEYEIGENRVRLEAGDILIVSPKTEHFSVFRSDILKKISVGFDISIEAENDLYGRLENLRTVGFYHQKAPEQISVVLNLILDHISENDPYAGVQKRALLNVFLLSLLNVLPKPEDCSNEENRPQARIEVSDETVYNAVLQYLQTNISRNFTLKELSDVLLISISQLNRRLIHYCGMPYSRIKDMVKCARARELLATDLSMAQISEAIGISNEYSFNRFFKRVEGMTPGKFREALQTNNYRK